MDQQTQTEVQLYPGDRKKAKIEELFMIKVYVNRMFDCQKDLLRAFNQFSEYLSKFEEATDEKNLLKLSAEEQVLFEGVKVAERSYRENTETVDLLRIALLNRVDKLREKIDSIDEIAD